MSLRSSILLRGLRIAVTKPGAMLWAYVINLGIAVAFSLRLNAQLAAILDHSLAAERLNTAFDLGTLQQTVHRLNYMAPSSGATSYIGLPLYVMVYFLLVPGTLFCYRADVPPRLSILLSSGVSYFWRFVRITLLTGVVSLAVLTPLVIAESSYAAHIEETVVGRAALLQEIPGILAIFLVAALVRLYFDLVEVYTVQLGDQVLENGRQDRRVRRVLLPALRTLGGNFGRMYLSFTGLTLAGFAAVVAGGWLAAPGLARPQVLPTFLLAQLGLMAMMATRFWQRATETVLAGDFPLAQPLPRVAEPEYERIESLHFPGDAQPDPEPAVLSLREPDPEVFHHDVTEPEPAKEEVEAVVAPVAEPDAGLVAGPVADPVAEPGSEPEGTPGPVRPVPWWQE